MSFTKLKGKAGLHARNRHNGRYDFSALCKVLPALKSHTLKTPSGEWSINFSDPESVKMLNKALLALHYNVTQWDIPKGYLCPPIPGRADYIHRMAEWLEKDCGASGELHALDIGMGANCIYPIIGATEYKWHCVGVDIDEQSVANARDIVAKNDTLNGHIECRLQPESRYFFKNVIEPQDRFHLSTCNPPFHKSAQDAMQGSNRKVNNLAKHKGQKTQPESKGTAALNFGGQSNELWTPGGEAAFIKNMAFESQQFAKQVLWFSTLISKKENVRWLKKSLEKAGACDMVVIEMSQGQKISRFAAWTFIEHDKRKLWKL